MLLPKNKAAMIVESQPCRIELSAATETVQPWFALSALPPSCAGLPGRPEANPFPVTHPGKLSSQYSNASAAILWCLSGLTRPRKVPVISVAWFAMATLALGGTHVLARQGPIAAIDRK